LGAIHSDQNRQSTQISQWQRFKSKQTLKITKIVDFNTKIIGKIPVASAHYLCLTLKSYTRIVQLIK